MDNKWGIPGVRGSGCYLLVNSDSGLLAAQLV